MRGQYNDCHIILSNGTESGRYTDFYVRGGGQSRCPCCGGELHVIGSRPRTVCQTDGSSISLIIRRFRCRECRKIHHELPDMLIPYKRHSSECIAGILTASYYPCETSTVMRLRIWFGILKQAVLELLQFPSEVRHFWELIAMSLSNPPESMETLLKFLVKKAANTGKRMLHRMPCAPSPSLRQAESSI